MPQDPPPTPASATADDLGAIITISPIEASSAADPKVVPPHLVGVDHPDEVSVDRPVVDDEGNKSDGGTDFLAWMKKELDDIKSWVGTWL